jgi:hypothetical protein
MIILDQSGSWLVQILVGKNDIILGFEYRRVKLVGQDYTCPMVLWTERTPTSGSMANFV